MKKTIYRILSAGMALLAVSCTEENKVTVPSFPEKQDFLKSAGETVELSIEPNMAWELTLNTPVTQFWFEEAGIQKAKLSGSAGAQTVTVHITNEPALDEDYICNVEMSMGKETRLVATIKVVADESYYRVYPAVWDDETSEWKLDENGAIVYSADAQSSIGLKFSQEDMEFTCPAKVEANFAWSVPAADVNWLEPVGETDKGVAEVVFTANSNAYPEGAADASVKVQRKGHDAADSNNELRVSIPDYRTIFICPALENGSTQSYKKEGNAGTIEEVNPYMVYTSKNTAYEVYSLENGVYSPMSSENPWIEVINTANDEYSLTYHDVKFKIQKNEETDARTAAVIVRTADKADAECLTEDGAAIADGFIYFVIEQEGSVILLEGPLAKLNVDEQTLKKMSFVNLSKADASYIYENFNCSYAYRMLASDPDAMAFFKEVPTNYTYEVQSWDGNQYTVKDNWWIRYAEPTEEDDLMIRLDPVTMNPYWESDGEDPYEESRISDITPIYEASYLVIRDGSSVVAVVECQFNEAAIIGDVELFEFMINDLGASLTCKDISDFGTVSDLLKENLYGITEAYELKTTSEGSVVISIPSEKYFPIKDAKTWLSVEKTGTREMTITFKEGTGTAIFQFNDISQGFPMPMTGLVIIKE